MSLRTALRHVVPIKWIIACVITWSLFAVMMGTRVFIINPMFTTTDKVTGVPELLGVSTVLVGSHSSYLRFDQSEIDCHKLERSNAIQCQSMFENERLEFTVARRTLGSNGSYTGHCQGVYDEHPFACLPIPGKSRNIIPVTIDGRLGLSNQRWNELYQERGYVMPNFDLESWIPFIALGLLLLTSILIWRQERRAYAIAKSTERLSIYAIRAVVKVGLAIFLLGAIYFVMLLLVWDIEDFVTRL